MFSKSKTKRFQDPVACGPAPGQYEVRDSKTSNKGIVFEKDKRWKDPNDDGSVSSYSSMENLSGSFKSLVPISQSTCRKKQTDTFKSKRKSCFISSSATDLSTRFSLDADVEFQTDKIRDLQAKIMQLESEISKLKASQNEGVVSPSVEEIINEKLSVELEKRKLEDNLKDLKAEELLRSEELVKTVNQLKSVFMEIVNDVNDKYSNLGNAFNKVCYDFQARLEQEKSKLVKISEVNHANALKFDSLKTNYDNLVIEQDEKDNFIEDQVKQVAECTDLVCQISSQLKLKEDSCKNLNVELVSSIEDGEKEKLSFTAQKEKILNQLANLESIHKHEFNELSNELIDAKNLNLEYRQQIENIELSMTDNIREISKKYESLEETFNKTQKQYQQRLERSNSLVEKTIEANRTCNKEFENLEKMYAELQHDYSQVCNENETNQTMLIETNKKIEEYAEDTKTHENQLCEKDDKIAKLENDIKEMENVLSNEDTKIKEFEVKVSSTLNQLEQKDNEIFEFKNTNQVLVNEMEVKNKKFVELEKSIQNMSSQLEEQKLKIDEYANNATSILETIRKKDNELVKYENKFKLLNAQLDEQALAINDYESNHEGLVHQINEHKNLIKDYENNTKILTEELETGKNLLADKDEQIDELEKSIELMSEQVESARKSTVNEDEFNELHSKLVEAENISEEWRLKFEELERKVGPFMDQLEQFQLEKKSLLDQNSLTQQEMKKLSERYGQILGHQNNKQKIRHISKLKDENYQLKAEVMKLRSTVQKDKVKINQLERSTQEGKRFDPTKSFCHGKENREVLKSVNS